MIDLDDEVLALAAKEFGTTTKKDTVNAALAFVAERRRRIDALLEDPYALGVGPDIGDVEVMARAERRRAQYVPLPINETVAARAREVQIRMATRGHNRAAGVMGLLTAAVAEHHGAVVLHYDGDFDHIAATTAQPHVWVVPRGGLP
jgi:Arc/MetJ family transcription regulator